MLSEVVTWPMPAWVWRDVRSVFFFFFTCSCVRHPGGARGIEPETFRKKGSAFITSSDHWTVCDTPLHTLKGTGDVRAAQHSTAQHTPKVHILQCSAHPPPRYPQG